jgi:hypothetical protein
LRVAHFGLRHGKEATSSRRILYQCREPGKERATTNWTIVSKITTPLWSPLEIHRNFDQKTSVPGWTR